ncbi:MAG: class II D-tagatose-bisphosphate aldolase, non-catalytic subunit [Cyclobacteriaceae bacterium]|nr:class II D-tagatose-bisphosphate aldolase, non-catalytic subunit [Cyclobacteriaceae bacterium]
MNTTLRERARKKGLSYMDFLLREVKKIEKETGIPRTFLAVCPNSSTVIRAALRTAKRNNAPIKFAATLNQVDLDGGYTGFTPEQFVRSIRKEAQLINFNGPVIIAIDHGGPWLKDLHRQEQWSLEQSMSAVKRTFEAAIDAGYDLIHVDPTVDITVPPGETIQIEVVVRRTVELIAHAETFRKSKKLPRIAYEVGTEEVHGGLADMNAFKTFLEQLKTLLFRNELDDAWPCFVVGKVGTDLHTTVFDPEVARKLSSIAARYGSVIKGHYSDNVSNPHEYPNSGMGGANVGPEFTEQEYAGLVELCDLEEGLVKKGLVVRPSNLVHILREAVVRSGRWKKWILPGESADDFFANSLERQSWLIKTGCRYIWENPEVVAARMRLYRNLEMNGFDAEEILLSHIEKSMDKYFHKLNLVDLNDRLMHNKGITLSIL